uniref:HAT C-terminal dimerisation domain-containing protein n=1 Tax=Trichuris muris TaxID=70415 RepID=A0A5S6QHH3_TRIMR
MQELLFAKHLVTCTKGESIFLAVDEVFKDKNIPLSHIIAVATGGAPSMVGRHRGFLAHLKRLVPNVLAVHCVIHRQHLVAKHLSERLNCSLQLVVAAINKIKSKSLNDRLFSQLCEQNDEDFNRLLLHTEIRWLSKGACLSRFYRLFDTVLEFLQDEDSSLREDLENRKNDVAYLADLYYKFNAMNLQLQGDGLNLIKTKAVVSAFVAKLVIFKRNMGNGEFYQFPLLAALKEKEAIADQDVDVYCQHLEMLHVDFVERFNDIINLKVPTWVMNPFCGVDEAEMELQEELIELQNNDELKPKWISGYQQFWLQRHVMELYPRLWAVVENFLIAFPSSYLVERGFSAVTELLSNKRNRLQIVNRGDLRLMMTKMKPDVEKLLSLHRVHPSH